MSKVEINPSLKKICIVNTCLFFSFSIFDLSLSMDVSISFSHPTHNVGDLYHGAGSCVLSVSVVTPSPFFF